MKFDIVNFYPSIRYDELEKAVEFARKFTNITTNEFDIIKHTCTTVMSDVEGSN